MITEFDTYSAATTIIRRYGEKARLHVTMRADATLEAGDLGGYAVRKNIVKTGQESLRVELRDDE